MLCVQLYVQHRYPEQVATDLLLVGGTGGSSPTCGRVVSARISSHTRDGRLLDIAAVRGRNLPKHGRTQQLLTLLCLLHFQSNRLHCRSRKTCCERFARSLTMSSRSGKRLSWSARSSSSSASSLWLSARRQRPRWPHSPRRSESWITCVRPSSARHRLHRPREYRHVCGPSARASSTLVSPPRRCLQRRKRRRSVPLAARHSPQAGSSASMRGGWRWRHLHCSARLDSCSRGGAWARGVPSESMSGSSSSRQMRRCARRWRPPSQM